MYKYNKKYILAINYRTLVERRQVDQTTYLSGNSNSITIGSFYKLNLQYIWLTKTKNEPFHRLLSFWLDEI